MSLLTGFIIVLVAITFQFTLYTIKRLQEPLESETYEINSLNEKKNMLNDYWENAEMTNGRLAMIGFLALIINYGFFGWIIPGFI